MLYSLGFVSFWYLLTRTEMSLKSLKRCLKSLKSCDTMRTVAVVSNILKPFKPASLPISMGLRQGFWVKWLFYCLRASALHARAEHLHGWLGRKHRATNHPVDNPTELCARYRERRKDMVRQDLHRLNRNPLREVGVLCTWAWCDVYHPWGNYCLKGIT